MEKNLPLSNKQKRRLNQQESSRKENLNQKKKNNNKLKKDNSMELQLIGKKSQNI